MQVPFVKYSGCGNDFIIIDNRTQHITAVPPRSAVAALCHRQSGIGADGFILLESSNNADFRMRIFNADGGETEMCGNGIRCLAHYLYELGVRQGPLIIETMHAHIPVRMSGKLINVSMPPPCDFRPDLSLPFNEKLISLHSLDTGVPHIVIFVEDLDNDPLLLLVLRRVSTPISILKAPMSTLPGCSQQMPLPSAHMKEGWSKRL